MAALATAPTTRAAASSPPSSLLALLRCVECDRALRLARLSDEPGYPDLGADGCLRCESCSARYPLIAGTVRMLPPGMQSRLWMEYPRAADALREAGIARPTGSEMRRRDVKQRTADSFAYEWERFGALRPEWRKNFLDYMQPHTAETAGARRRYGIRSSRASCG
jgi:uncharacterized protein YbaR (Trm112 family)